MGEKRGGKRGISAEVTRRMKLLAHGSFRQRVRHNCYKRGTIVFWGTGEHTSKTCSCCNAYRGDLGASSFFLCANQHCRLVEGRDVNGAINVYRLNIQRIEHWLGIEPEECIHHPLPQRGRTKNETTQPMGAGHAVIGPKK